MSYELTNEQRKYFGLDPIMKSWDRILLKGDIYRPDSFLYFDGDTIKKHIISTENIYHENQYNELTKDRTILLPKTSKGKEQKLTAAVLERRQPIGVYLYVEKYGAKLIIGSYTTQTTFYTNLREKVDFTEIRNIPDIIDDFIKESPTNHLKEIEEFKNAKRKNIKFRSGDYFCFKLTRTQYGFGRVLLDIYKISKKGLIKNEHGLNLLMGRPVLIQIFAYSSTTKNIDISILENIPRLPSDYIMDNVLFYGEYEIIGHKDLSEEEFDFPISYGRSIDIRRSDVVFLQWGLIHKELPIDKFNKYIMIENPFTSSDRPSRKVQNPFGYYSIGFEPTFDTVHILETIRNNGEFNYDTNPSLRMEFDLRNPKNKSIRNEILKAFDLDPEKNYIENCKLMGIPKTTDILKQLYKS